MVGVMRWTKLPVLCFLTALMVAPVAVRAQYLSPEAQLQTFAICVGRLSAVVEYEWMSEGAVSDEAERQRDMAVQLVAAIISNDQSRDVLNWRNAAKNAQFALMTRAEYSDDRAEAAWATQRATLLRQECTSLLLS